GDDRPVRRTETEAPADPVAAALAAGAGGPPFAAPLAGSAALLVSGPDAATFLHGQLANDVTGLSEGATNRSLLLNHKGHAMAEAQVLRLARESFLVVVDDGLVDWVEATLVRHVVFDEVTLARVAAAAVTVQGERAGAALGAALAALAGPDPSASGAGEPAAGEGAPVPPAEGAFRALDTADGHAYAYAARRSLAGGYDVLAPTPAVADALMGALAAAGAVGVDAAGVDAARASCPRRPAWRASSRSARAATWARRSWPASRRAARCAAACAGWSWRASRPARRSRPTGASSAAWAPSPACPAARCGRWPW